MGVQASESTMKAGGAMPPATVLVWDRFVRVFHWSLVLLFATAFITGDEIEGLHIAAGYAIAALILLRVIWGFAGSYHARFRNFVRPPRAVLGYMRAAVRLEAPRHLGHNPAGAAMIVVLLIMLAGLCATGYMMTTDMLWGAKWVEEVHEALANAALGLVVLHVLGVLVASLEHGESLIWAMVTGRKRRM